MVQDSQQSKEAASLVILTVLNAQVMLITAQNVFQDSLLIQDQENVFLKLAVLTVKSSIADNVSTFVTMVSTSMKVFAYMEDALMDILLMPSMDV